MKRTIAASLFFALLAPLALWAQGSGADNTDNYVEGQHYIRIDTPVKTQNPDKVEVVEVFWYGCHHCYTFEPMVEAWQKQLPEYVDFHQSPAIWSGPMRLHAQAFYTAKALDVLDKVHSPLFNALNVEGKRLLSKDEIGQVFVDQGIAKADFDKAWSAFGVSAQVNQADARARSYKISGTPEMIVNGKFRVTARSAGSQAGMLDVVDYLITREQAQLANAR
ncbi:MAG TPA: thiol:disulfide interchange protein DsbA/DsbL [Spongiibacteraceae bacterium]|nr:thiol:disulfide interchange protein DsbA/DsbL [Spongiibacteraceae bacterium]